MVQASRVSRRASPASVRVRAPRRSRAAPLGDPLARTIARMPALIASGRFGQACTIRARSGLDHSRNTKRNAHVLHACNSQRPGGPTSFRSELKQAERRCARPAHGAAPRSIGAPPARPDQRDDAHSNSLRYAQPRLDWVVALLVTKNSGQTGRIHGEKVRCRLSRVLRLGRMAA